MKLFIYIILNLVFIQIVLNAEISLPTEYKLQDFDVQHYEVFSQILEPNTKYINGYSKILIDWNTNDDERTFYFHLFNLQVDSILYDGVKFDDFIKKESYYEITPNINNELNSSTITIYFQGVMMNEGGSFSWGGVQFSQNILYQMGVAFYHPNVSMGSFWFPCYDHPSDKATFKFIFETPDNYTVASNGNLDIEYINDDGNKITEFSSSNLIATYLMTFAISDYILLEYDYNGIPIHIYTKSADSTASDYSYQNVPLMLEAFEHFFGPYPFEKVGYVNTILGSMEHQTMVSMEVQIIRNSYFGSNPYHSVLVHELAHQWFGNSISARDFRDIWLSETFATYSESLFLEYLNGFENYITNQIAKKNRYITVISFNEGLLSLYDFERKSSNYPETIYQKGAVILGMLRYKLGDDFFEYLKELNETYKNGNINTNELKEFFEIQSGENLTQFWEQWIYSKYFPKFNITVQTVSDQIRIIAEQTQEGNSFIDVPLEFRFITDNEEFNYIFHTTQLVDTFYVAQFEFNNVNVNSGPTVISLLQVVNLDVITSVDDEKIDEIAILPNPAFEYIELQNVHKEQILVHLVQIYDVMGKNMYPSGISISEDFRIDISKLPSGIYFIKIDNDFKKFIKL